MELVSSILQTFNLVAKPICRGIVQAILTLLLTYPVNIAIIVGPILFVILKILLMKMANPNPKELKNGAMSRKVEGELDELKTEIKRIYG